MYLNHFVLYNNYKQYTYNYISALLAHIVLYIVNYSKKTYNLSLLLANKHKAANGLSVFGRITFIIAHYADTKNHNHTHTNTHIRSTHLTRIPHAFHPWVKVAEQQKPPGNQSEKKKKKSPGISESLLFLRCASAKRKAKCVKIT